MVAPCGCHVAFQVVLRAFWDSQWLLVPCVAFWACCGYPVISWGCLGAVFKGCSWGRLGALPVYSPFLFCTGHSFRVVGGFWGFLGQLRLHWIPCIIWGSPEVLLGFSWGSPGVVSGLSWGIIGALLRSLEALGLSGGCCFLVGWFWGISWRI